MKKKSHTISRLHRSLRFCSTRRLYSAILLFALVGVVSTTQAAIPTSEREVLVDLYNSTDGVNWSNKMGWLNAVGSECAWFGVICDTEETHVIAIALYGNHLTGPIPSLAGLTNLLRFQVPGNELTGLQSLEGLLNLETFWVFDNQLTGPIPSLAGLTSLQDFVAYNNQLSGPIPTLAGLTNLKFFAVADNQLSGHIPPLAGLLNLTLLDVSANELTGSIPPLAGLASLQQFRVEDNELTGPLPPFVGLPHLWWLNASNNHLTGAVPSLADLTNLTHLYINGNQLSGDAPDAQSPNGLIPSGSSLCPNALNPIPSAAWDFATGQTPWYLDCFELPDLIFIDGFDG